LEKDTIVRYTASKAVSRIVLSLPSSLSDEIVAILFQKMEEGLLKEDKEWDFSSIDENIWHGCLLCIADIAWHAGIQCVNLENTVIYAMNVNLVPSVANIGFNLRLCKRPEASWQCC
jgi:hypothetical protein